MKPMKKMALGQTLQVAVQHGQEQRAVVAAPPRPNKTELAERSDMQHGKAPREPRPAAPKPKPKAKPPRVVQAIRENISFSRDDIQRIARLITRGEKISTRPTKSEVVRAALFAYEHQSNEQFDKALRAIPRLKPGPQKRSSVPQ